MVVVLEHLDAIKTGMETGDCCDVRMETSEIPGETALRGPKSLEPYK